MNETTTSSNFNEALERAPQPVKDFIFSDEYTDAIYELGKKLYLHIDQTAKLSDMVMSSIIGLFPSTDLPSKVAKEIQLSEDQANILVYDLNQTIFLPLRQKIYQGQSTNNQHPTEKSEETTPLPSNSEEKTANFAEAPKTNPARDIFAQKMSSDFGLPKEKVEIGSSPSAKPTETATVEPPRKRDPYREPVE